MGAQAQAAPGAAESIAVSPSVVEGGAQITIVGTGWTCAADVDIFIEDGGLQLVASVSWDDIVDGGFSVVTAAPNEVGDYDVIAEYGNAQTSVSCEGRANDPFTVVVTPTTTTTPETTTTTTTVAETTTTTTVAATTTTVSDTTTSTTTTIVGVEGPTTTTSTTVVGNEGPTTTAGPVRSLPVTGATTNTVLPIALAAVAFGGLLVVTTRRRTAR